MNINQDAHEFIKAYSFEGGEFVYADSPYLLSSRKSKFLYQFEYSQQQHEELLALLIALPCKVMISALRVDDDSFHAVAITHNRQAVFCKKTGFGKYNHKIRASFTASDQ